MELYTRLKYALYSLIIVKSILVLLNAIWPFYDGLANIGFLDIMLYAMLFLFAPLLSKFVK